MDEELKALLKSNLRVSEESLAILKKLNAARIMGSIMGVVKWVVILAVTFGTYYYLQPFLERGLDVITNPAGILEDALGNNNGVIDPNKLSPDTIKKIRDSILSE